MTHRTCEVCKGADSTFRVEWFSTRRQSGRLVFFLCDECFRLGRDLDLKPLSLRNQSIRAVPRHGPPITLHRVRYERRARGARF